MCTDLIVIRSVRPQDTAQVRFAEHDEVVESFATYRSDEPLNVAVMPRRAWRRGVIADSHPPHSGNDREIRDLIRRMSKETSLWGAPRIHGELLMLGIEVAQSTVARYIQEVAATPVPALEDVPAQSRCRYRVERPVRRAHSFIQAA